MFCTRLRKFLGIKRYDPLTGSWHVDIHRCFNKGLFEGHREERNEDFQEKKFKLTLQESPREKIGKADKGVLFRVRVHILGRGKA